MLKKYQSEIRYLKYYIINIIIVTSLSYSVYLFCSDKQIMSFNNENGIFELGTAVLFLLSSFIFMYSNKMKKNIFLLSLSILMFVGAGEEVSWGQSFLGFNTPKELKTINVQGEFNIHNIEIFNSNNFNHTHKTGWKRITEINFLFRAFIMIYGVIFPIFVNHNKLISLIVKRFQIPIIPIGIGLFFLIIWLGLEGLLKFLPAGKPENYYSSTVEIFEFLTSYIFFTTSIYFALHRNQPIAEMGSNKYIEPRSNL